MTPYLFVYQKKFVQILLSYPISLMIDSSLFFKLLKASLGVSVVLVGDVNQLPPIGCGNPFKDLIESKVVPTTTLVTLFRQAKESQICINANAVLEGKVIEKSLALDLSKSYLARGRVM